MSQQLDILTLIAEGEELRRQGMERSIKHADEANKDWSRKAYDVFVRYVASLKPGTQFKSEDVRVFAKIHEQIETPPSERAWGAIAVKAKENGLIRKIGFTEVTNPKAHRTPCALWEVI